jgi:hypothetical protein
MTLVCAISVENGQISLNPGEALRHVFFVMRASLASRSSTSPRITDTIVTARDKRHQGFGMMPTDDEEITPQSLKTS